MFTTISWSNYSIAIGALLSIWYLFLGFRFYYPDLKQFSSGKRSIKFPAIANRKTKQSCLVTNDEDDSRPTMSSSFFQPFNSSKEAEKLSGILINAIAESVERNLSKAELQTHLKLLLNDYPDVKNSTLRATINELMVSECEKHPQMILTYAEVDVLWDETI
ncbi:hypothetical protein D3C85_761910 [compost metagenome]